MVEYWVLLIGALAAGLALEKVKHGRAIYCVLIGAAMFIMSAVRAHVGYDYNLYGGWFMDAQFMGEEDIMLSRIERGFMIPMKLISDLTADYQVMFVIISFIITGAVMLYIFLYAEKPYLSVFFYLTFGLFFNSMDFMRQMIAAAVALYAMQYIRKKQPLRFLIFILFASAFHISVLILIPFYFILRIRMDGLTLGIYSALAVVFLVFIKDILDFITSYVYKGQAQHGVPGSEGIATNPIYAVFFSVFFLLCFILRKELVKEDAFNNVLLNCMFFTAFFEIMGTRYAILSRFVVVFFIPAVVIFVPRVFLLLLRKCETLLKGQGKRIKALQTAVTVLVMGSCVFMYGYMIQNNYNGVTPYRTIFSEEAAYDE